MTSLKSTEVSKAASLENLCDSFRKDGGKVLAKPITDLWSLLKIKI